MGESNMDVIDRQIAELQGQRARLLEEELTRAQVTERERQDMAAQAMRDLVRDYNLAASNLREFQLALFHVAADMGLEVLFNDGMHWPRAAYPKGPTQTPEKRLAKALVTYVADHRVGKIGGFPV